MMEVDEVKYDGRLDKYLNKPLGDLASMDESTVMGILKHFTNSFIKEHHVSMTTEGVTSAVIRLLNHNSLRVLRKATAVLWDLAAYDDNKVAIVSMGATGSILKLMKAPYDRIQRNASYPVVPF